MQPSYHRGVTGVVYQVNVSKGGVPKRPVPSAEIVAGGVVGDEQADRIHHGGPDQDLCLYSLEVIEALQAEGHPIAPGSAGENLTLAGIDWARMEIGVRLRIGDRLIAEITATASPCSKNARWFEGRDFRRIDAARHPGWSRWYARVVEPGTVAPGDPVEVVHAADTR